MVTYFIAATPTNGEAMPLYKPEGPSWRTMLVSVWTMFLGWPLLRVKACCRRTLHVKHKISFDVVG